jgi:hypothetical protein
MRLLFMRRLLPMAPVAGRALRLRNVSTRRLVSSYLIGQMALMIMYYSFVGPHMALKLG